MENNLTWENVSDHLEKVTEEEVRNAESMGRIPAGKFLVTCVESTPKEIALTNYNCIAANLKFQVNKVLQIEGKPVDSKDYQDFESKPIWDTIFLHNPLEKDGMRKRRIFIAKRMGLLQNGNQELSNKVWAHDVINKQVILTTEENEWEDKMTGALKKNIRVAFNGYEQVANQPSATGTTDTIMDDSFSDI